MERGGIGRRIGAESMEILTLIIWGFESPRSYILRADGLRG